ncbi:MAG: hypothetical protein WCT77_13885 [Bacteroidota bacterium]
MKIKILSLFLSIFFLSCTDDTIDSSNTKAPEIEYILDSMTVDLNQAKNLPVMAVVYAEAGIESVNMFIIRNGSEELYSKRTTFLNKNKYSVKESIPYDETITGFKIVAEDKTLRTTTKSLDISIISYQFPPIIIFDPNIINIDENNNDTIPITKFSVKSSSSTYLDKVDVYLYTESGQSLILSENFEGRNDTVFEYENLLPYKQGDRSLQVIATDRYNKKTIGSLAVTYKALPPPLIYDISDTLIVADVNATKNISFKVSSKLGIRSITVSKSNSKGETIINNFDYNGEKNLSFNTNVTFDNNISGVKFTVVDTKGRQFIKSIPAIVGLNYNYNYTIGGQYYIRGFAEEPETRNIFSMSKMHSITLNEAYNNIPDADFHIYMYYGAAGSDNGIRLNSWGQASSPSQLGEVEFADLLNNIPFVNTWPNRNKTLFLALDPVNHGFTFENATLNDLVSFVPAINKDRITSAPLGTTYLIKTASTSTAGSKIGMIKFESMVIPTTVPYEHSYGTNYSVKKAARIKISIKFPK